MLNENILTSVKKIIGITDSYDAFDMDLIIHINTVLGILNQMGIGKQGFFIQNKNETWSDFLTATEVNLNAVITWTALKVRMIFDPPSSNGISEAIKNTLDELEWRIYITENYIGEI